MVESPGASLADFSLPIPTRKRQTMQPGVPREVFSSTLPQAGQVESCEAADCMGFASLL
jgi:hypothetical protein